MQYLIAAILLIAVAPPCARCDEKAPKAEESKPLKFGISLPVADDAKIYVESLFPTGKEKVKVLTKEEFRKHAKTIMYHEYKLTKIVVDKMEIKELHFRLPTPDEYKSGEVDPRDIVRANATKP